MQKTCFNTSALNSRLSMVWESDMNVNIVALITLLFHHLGERYCLPCVHMLLHLTDAVRNLGPLVLSETFPPRDCYCLCMVDIIRPQLDPRVFQKFWHNFQPQNLLEKYHINLPSSMSSCA